MHLAYVDDSGNTGLNGSKTFTLGCVLVEAESWTHGFDGLIEFRRYLKTTFKIPVRAELKANWLVQNSGSICDLALSERARHGVYRGFMRLQAKLGFKAFAVVIQKQKLHDRGKGEDPRAVAWEYLFQRLERFTTSRNSHVMLIHDEGDEKLVRQLARKARRAGTAGSMFNQHQSLRRPATRIIEDPFPRRSHESYFIQLADLTAYAAFRKIHPPTNPRKVPVVPQNMWDELGTAVLSEVSNNAPNTLGIVVWPR